jgi:hypothetical protein
MQGYTYLLIIIQWKIKIQYLIAFKKQAIRIPIVLILQLTKEYKSNLLIASMGLIFTIQKITREFNTKNKIHFESNSDTHIEIGKHCQHKHLLMIRRKFNWKKFTANHIQKSKIKIEMQIKIIYFLSTSYSP